ncbi:MAG: hypothetical protein MJK04_23350, partial [Psychrosphaera sp.]|nr:hypothetical protein [Psychrosphaera sp.]
MMVKRVLPAALMLSASMAAQGGETFVVKDMKIEGLQRVTVGATLTHIPFSIGDEVSGFDLSRTVRQLYSSGFFDNIEVHEDADVVTFVVKERPIIDEVTYDGNKDIKDEQLEESMTSNGLLAGETLDKTMKQKYKNEEVISPGTVIISAAAHCTNIQQVVSPVLQKDKGSIYYINISQDAY